MDARALAALLALLSMLAGWVVGRERGYGPLAERLMLCEQGLGACDHGLTRCSGRLDYLESWAVEARQRMLSGRGRLAPVGPVERRP